MNVLYEINIANDFRNARGISEVLFLNFYKQLFSGSGSHKGFYWDPHRFVNFALIHLYDDVTLRYYLVFSFNFTHKSMYLHVVYL